MLKSRAVKFISIPVVAMAVVVGTASVSLADTSVTVRQGQTLSIIAASHGTSWQYLRDINSLNNPNLIYPGEVIKLGGVTSTPSSPTVYQPIVNIENSSQTASSSTVNWDAIASCESSGDWSADTGNGFYGGLQFTESTWLAYGGGFYAQFPNQASQGDQETVANAVLASQGIGAWPVCGTYGN